MTAEEARNNMKLRGYLSIIEEIKDKSARGESWAQFRGEYGADTLQKLQDDGFKIETNATSINIEW